MKRTGVYPFAIPIFVLALVAPALADVPFTEESVARGIAYTTGHTFGYGAGVALVDLDGDGDPDIVLLGDATTGKVGVYENDGTGNFVDRSNTSGIPLLTNTSGITAPDYDGDGDRDLYISRNFAADVLMRNDGSFSFTNVTSAAGMGDAGAGHGSTWGDYDADGWIDMYLGNRTDLGSEEENRLYHNLGNGTFEEVAAALGVDRPGDPTFHAAFLDYNRDGLPDIYVCNDKGVGCNWTNHLFRNDGGTFTNVSVATGTDACLDCMGIGIGDMDHNGFADMYLTNTPPGNALLLNQDGSTFVDSATTAGVSSYATGWGNIFFDYDNDTYLDLYVCNSDAPNRLYEYDGAFPATDIAGAVGVATVGTHFTSSAADIDGDGDLDLLVSGALEAVRLYINHEGETRNWLKVRPVGQPPNTQAVGAVIEVTVGGQTWEREVFCGIGFKSDWPTTQHFGLGAAAMVDQVTITWPDGTQGVLEDVAANQEIVLQDSDVDGSLDGSDCAPGDSTLWGTPGEVLNVQLQHDAPSGETTLDWDPPAEPGATNVFYDVLRSDDPEDFTTPATCTESNDADTTATDSATPAAGSGWYFLVRCENGCPAGLGTLGMRYDGERTGLVCP